MCEDSAGTDTPHLMSPLNVIRISIYFQFQMHLMVKFIKKERNIESGCNFFLETGGLGTQLQLLCIADLQLPILQIHGNPESGQTYSVPMESLQKATNQALLLHICGCCQAGGGGCRWCVAPFLVEGTVT